MVVTITINKINYMLINFGPMFSFVAVFVCSRLAFPYKDVNSPLEKEETVMS